MIHSSKAVHAAQKFNRNQWLKHAEAKLSDTIMSASRQGLRSVNVCLHTITTGAENLAEIGEMCILLNGILVDQSYTVKYSINGNLTISW